MKSAQCSLPIGKTRKHLSMPHIGRSNSSGNIVFVPLKRQYYYWQFLIFSGLTVIVNLDYSTLFQGLVVAGEKKKSKSFMPGQDLNPEHPLKRNCFYPLNHSLKIRQLY